MKSKKTVRKKVVSKQAKIRKLLDQLPIEESTLTAFRDQTTKLLKLTKINVSQEHLQAILERVLKTLDIGILIDVMVDVYNRNYTEAEISYMCKYYDTKTGKAILAKTLDVNKELVKVCDQWGQDSIINNQKVIGDIVAEVIGGIQSNDDKKDFAKYYAFVMDYCKKMGWGDTLSKLDAIQIEDITQAWIRNEMGIS